MLAALGLIAAWISFIVYKKRTPRVERALTRHGVDTSLVSVTLRTTRFNRLIHRMGSPPPGVIRRMMQAWFSAGPVAFLMVSLASVAFLGVNLRSACDAAPQPPAQCRPRALHSADSTFHSLMRALEPRPVDGSSQARSPTVVLTPLVPGLNLPLALAPPLLAAIFLATCFHELGHALAATLHKIRVLHVGFFLSAGLPGAYVSVDPAVAAHRPSKQLRVYCAGVWHNLMLAAAAMAALACVPALVSPLLATPAGSGLCVAAVHADSPLAPVLGVGDAVTHANGRPLGEAAAWWSEIDAARGQPLIAPAVAEAEGEEVVEEPITQESRTAHPAGPHLHAAGEWGRMAPSLRARAVGREPGSGEHSQYRIGAPLCVPSSYLLPSPHAVDAVSETPAPAPAASQEEDRESHIRPDTVVPPPPTPPAGLRGVGGDEPGLRAAEAYEERTRLAAAAADAGPVAGPVRHLLRGQGTAGMRGGMRMGQVEELSGAEPSAAEPSAAAAEARAAAQSAAAARLGQSADPRRCCPRYMVPAVQRRSALTQDAESQPPVPSLQCVAVPVAALGVTTPPAAGDAASVLACVPSSSLAEDTEPAQCRAACESGAAATLEGTACARPLLEGNDVMVRLDRPNATAVLFHGPAPALTRGLTLGAWHPRPWLRAALGGDEGPASQREAAAPDDGRRHPLRGSHAGEAGPQPRRAAPGKGQSRALLAAALWLPDAMGTFLWLLACVSTSLAVLNSVPCHGLDGQHAFTALLAPGGKGQAAAALRWLLRGGTALLLANLVAVAASALPAS